MTPSSNSPDDIARSKSADDYHRGLRRALDSFDALQSGIVSDSGVKLACGAGCALCCWLRVDLYAHEVLLIATHFGFDTTIYELGTSLAEALSDPASWERWQNGEKAFLHASVTPSA